MSEEFFNVTGWLDWTLYDENGQVKASGADHNQVQNQMKRDMATRLPKGGASAASFFAIMGLGTGAVGGVSATSLTNWCAGPPTTIAPDGTTSDMTASFTATVPAGRQTGSIQSAGFFSTTTATGLKCWASCVVTKGAGDSLALTWTITFS